MLRQQLEEMKKQNADNPQVQQMIDRALQEMDKDK